MEEERKAIRTMREFISWFDKERYFISPACSSISENLLKFYVKFKYIVDQEPPEKPLVIER